MQYFKIKRLIYMTQDCTHFQFVTRVYPNDYDLVSRGANAFFAAISSMLLKEFSNHSTIADS